MLAAAVPRTRLLDLNLCGTQLDLFSMCMHSALVHADLAKCAQAGNGIGDVAMSAFAAALPRARLTNLNLVGAFACMRLPARLTLVRCSSINGMRLFACACALLANRLSGQGACVLVAVLAHTALKKLAINRM